MKILYAKKTKYRIKEEITEKLRIAKWLKMKGLQEHRKR